MPDPQLIQVDDLNNVPFVEKLSVEAKKMFSYQAAKMFLNDR